MFTNVTILVNGDTETQTVLVGIGEPYKIDEMDDGVFFYFESVEDINSYTDPEKAEYFTVLGVDSRCFGCDYFDDMTMPYGLDDGSQIVLLCPDCMPG